MYAVIKVVNGNFFIDTEGIKNLTSAKTRYHGLCQTLWNAADVITAHVMIADEQLNVVNGYKEFIYHEPAADA